MDAVGVGAQDSQHGLAARPDKGAARVKPGAGKSQSHGGDVGKITIALAPRYDGKLRVEHGALHRAALERRQHLRLAAELQDSEIVVRFDGPLLCGEAERVIRRGGKASHCDLFSFQLIDLSHPGTYDEVKR